MRCKEVSAGGFGDIVFFLLKNIDEMGAMSLLRKYGGHWASNVGGKAWEMEPIACVQVTPGVREHHSYKSSSGGVSGGAVNSLALSARPVWAAWSAEAVDRGLTAKGGRSGQLDGGLSPLERSRAPCRARAVPAPPGDGYE